MGMGDILDVYRIFCGNSVNVHKVSHAPNHPPRLTNIPFPYPFGAVSFHQWLISYYYQIRIDWLFNKTPIDEY